MIEIVATDGYEAVTVRGLAKRARVSSGTFYRHYTSTDDCLLCAYDAICGLASRRLTEASRNEREPQRRLAMAVNCLFHDMAAAPQVATFMLRAAPTVGPAFTSPLWASAMRLGVALEYCVRSDDSPPITPLLLEGMIAGLARIGTMLPAGAEEDEIVKATSEAVEWIMSLCASVAEAYPPLAAKAPELRNGLPVPSRLIDGGWDGTLGDERGMLLAAVFRIAKSGYNQLSVPRICREAGVSRRNFNRYFASLEDCFVTAVEEHVSRAIKGSIRRRESSASWNHYVSATLETLCEEIEGESDRAARVLFIEITAAGTQGIVARDRLISQAACAIRTAVPRGEAPTELASEASAGALWAILRRQVLDRDLLARDALPVLSILVLAPMKTGNAVHGCETKSTIP
jgi:AcrR family transcriptional regulator